jgi:hypothetical protein
MAQEIFKRYELKYRLTKEQFQELLDHLKDRIVPDVYGKYTICNIYFDTPDYELIRKSLSKPYYKEKLRLRSYGVPGYDDPVYAEIKKKVDGIVYKRRTEMSLGEAEAYFYENIPPTGKNQILNELEWFRNRYETHPAVYLAYDRIAYCGKEDKEIRITFDSNIRYREEDLTLEEGSEGKNLLPPGEVLMELKLPERMPVWLGHILSQTKAYPTNFSKYGMYYKMVKPWQVPIVLGQSESRVCTSQAG